MAAVALTQAWRPRIHFVQEVPYLLLLLLQLLWRAHLPLAQTQILSRDVERQSVEMQSVKS